MSTEQSDLLSPPTPTSTTGPTPAYRRRLPVALAALPAAWLLTIAVTAVDARWALPPLVLLATASLLRGGRTLLDRLLLATMLLVCLTAAAGLLFAAWPWGMAPIPVTGTALTVLILAALATGRRPALPRPAWADLFPVLGTAALVGYLAQPVLRAADVLGQLTILGRGEDYFRHLTLVDVIGRQSGYVFVDPDAVREQLVSLLVYYPQGWHLLVALLDGHLTPPGTTPAGVDAVQPFLWWNIAGFGLFALALLWAAQRLPGPLHPLSRGVLTVVVGALVLGTQMPRMLLAGYPTETLGLTLTVVLAALVARPIAAPREHLLMLGALLVGIGYTYYLFLPAAALIVLGALLAHRREVLRVRGTALAVGLAAAALAPVPILLGVLRANQTESLTATVGPDLTETWLALGGLGAIVVPALLWLALLTGRADPAWRRWLFVLLVSVGLTAGIAQASVGLGGEPGYYFNKAGHLTTVLLIVGTAAVVRLLPVPRGRRPRPAVVAGLTAVTVAAATVLFAGVTGWHRSLLVVETPTWAQIWVHQQLDQPTRAAVVCDEVDRRYPPVPGVTTLVLDRSPYGSYLENICVSTLQGTTAQTESGIYEMDFVEPDRTSQMLYRTPGEIRLIVTTDGARVRVNRLFRADPELRERITVELMLVDEP
ncbi:hypothetical protein SAMN05443287_104232 [Micromonospora phaseoli]|uniref:4-amino-4-deoxy-L-arabinose transferase n=1 Tax=Micromonospora phaseoli TaxID=1144548 RepID=A0A1H6YV21_9ACTN|nr:hypothetical protein [Micromonospora phaseoli]PZW00204.1 hypothetical protein CLV64_103231 [Micromonospora phaseoli]GIJ78911.1 hypothetical protein Xph01_33430 [Micromonospora phaseoli]SEJ40665.1 hypothetical protein SAMN05443287_104232 [Micromonospora phaseoli]